MCVSRCVVLGVRRCVALVLVKAFYIYMVIHTRHGNIRGGTLRERKTHKHTRIYSAAKTEGGTLIDGVSTLQTHDKKHTHGHAQHFMHKTHKHNGSTQTASPCLARPDPACGQIHIKKRKEHPCAPTPHATFEKINRSTTTTTKVQRQRQEITTTRKQNSSTSPSCVAPAAAAAAAAAAAVVACLPRALTR